MSFSVSIAEYSAKRLVGMKVRTTMQKAQFDCPSNWRTFGPRIVEIPACSGGGQGAYGVSLMLNENDFDYWAAVEASPQIAVPDGMETVDIPAGLYAKCAVANLEQLGEAYMYVYGTWIREQAEYTLDEKAPCFESYPPNWRINDAFEIYVPLKKKAVDCRL